MKKFLAFILAIVILGTFSGCSSNKPQKEENFLAGQTLEFSGADINGQKVTKDLLKDYDLIIINKWGTYCNPCVKEMPDIQKIQDEFKDKKVKVIGVISLQSEKDKDDAASTAKKIIDVKKVNYLNILPDEKLNKQLSKFEFVPVTLFVKPDGKILKTYIPGTSDYAYLKQITDAALKGEIE